MTEPRFDDIEALLAKAKANGNADTQRRMSLELSELWQSVMELHDHTTAATQLREAGLEREFWLLALADAGRLRETAEAYVKALSVDLVRHHNVATTTVSSQAGVSQSTVSRWTSTAETR